MEYLPPIHATQSASTLVTPDGYGVCTLTLQQNHIYTIAEAPTLTALTLTLGTGCKYCVVDFCTGATAPTFAVTSGFCFSGANCSSGTFTPVANKHYRVALQNNGYQKLAYVQGVCECAIL